jgi:hypothetical protein
MTLEQQTDNVLAVLVRLVLDRRTHSYLLDLRRGQRPADPPFNLVALLAEVAMGVVVAKLKTAFVVTSNLVCGVGSPLEPPDLGVAELDPCRASFTERKHDSHRTVSPSRWRLLGPRQWATLF